MRRSLYRDADMESMSDGWDNATAHGWLDPLDDPTLGPDNPARHGATLRLAALNSGLWWVGATWPSLRLMQIMEYRMATEDLWDQVGGTPAANSRTPVRCTGGCEPKAPPEANARRPGLRGWPALARTNGA